MIPSSSLSNALGTDTPLPVSSNHLYTSNSGKSFEEIMAEQMSTQQIELDRLENTKDEKLKSTLPEETRNRIGVLPPPKNPQQLPVACGRPKIDYSKLGVDDFQKLKLIGKGDVGKVYLVLLKGTDLYFAMKILNKEEMISRNKVKRVLTGMSLCWHDDLMIFRKRNISNG